MYEVINLSRNTSVDQGMKASGITLAANIFLAIIKYVAGIVGNSSAMVADATHTMSDVGTTVAVMLALKISSKDADERYPYGHERYELIISKLLGMVLILTGAWIGYQAVMMIYNGVFTPPGKIALIAAAISIVIKEIMYRYTMKVAKDIGSLAMEADAWHHRSDAFSSIGTFVGILGARLGFPVLDPIAGVVVSIMVVKVGIDIYSQSVKGLVDEAADLETRMKIKSIVLENPGVVSIKDMRTRKFANHVYVDLDIKVDGKISVTEGHNIALEVHDRVEKKMDSVKHVMVHVEPNEE